MINQDIRLIRILRNMKWQEYKGNLNALLEACSIMEISRKEYSVIYKTINDFITVMEEECLNV